MTEENQLQEEPQQVTTKKPKKVEAGKRLAAHSHRKREDLKTKREDQAQKGELNQYYGIGVGSLGYYIYRTKQPLHRPPGPGVARRPHIQSNNPPQPSSRPQSNKFEMY